MKRPRIRKRIEQPPKYLRVEFLDYVSAPPGTNWKRTVAGSAVPAETGAIEKKDPIVKDDKGNTDQ